ncbi:hypothetical protein QR685DRAFT_522413 [Neurospora intermedia]|uniref:Uncharacterized protein n=1 Tax=Neurospora intermedia TaxID=5142 RepID=A0ABR3DL85_NEUIN
MLSRSAKDTVWFTVVCFLALITSVFAECNREGLLAAANSYVAAFSAGQLDGLKLASSNFTYLENNKAADIKRGVLSQSHNISLNRSTVETIACASYTMIISLASGFNSRPYVTATQIRHPANGDTSTVSSIDTITATTGCPCSSTPKRRSGTSRRRTGASLRRRRIGQVGNCWKKVGDAYLDICKGG